MFWKRFQRKPNPRDELWHKCRTPFPLRRTVDGKFIMLVGQCWRRWNGSRWEYKQDEETDEHYQWKQW